jgi:hypothetical protein
MMLLGCADRETFLPDVQESAPQAGASGTGAASGAGAAGASSSAAAGGGGQTTSPLSRCGPSPEGFEVVACGLSPALRLVGALDDSLLAYVETGGDLGAPQDARLLRIDAVTGDVATIGELPLVSSAGYYCPIPQVVVNAGSMFSHGPDAGIFRMDATANVERVGDTVEGDGCGVPPLAAGSRVAWIGPERTLRSVRNDGTGLVAAPLAKDMVIVGTEGDDLYATTTGSDRLFRRPLDSTGDFDEVGVEVPGVASLEVPFGAARPAPVLIEQREITYFRKDGKEMVLSRRSLQGDESRARDWVLGPVPSNWAVLPRELVSAGAWLFFVDGGGRRLRAIDSRSGGVTLLLDAGDSPASDDEDVRQLSAPIVHRGATLVSGARGGQRVPLEGVVLRKAVSP